MCMTMLVTNKSVSDLYIYIKEFSKHLYDLWQSDLQL